MYRSIHLLLCQHVSTDLIMDAYCKNSSYETLHPLKEFRSICFHGNTRSGGHYGSETNNSMLHRCYHVAVTMTTLTLRVIKLSVELQFVLRKIADNGIGRVIVITEGFLSDRCRCRVNVLYVSFTHHDVRRGTG